MIIGSIFTDEQELLKPLLLLHNESKPIELDPMYSKGNFYKEIEQPIHKYDISPQTEDCLKGDARELPIIPGSIQCMILDPPFCFGIHGKTRENISARRFTIIQTFGELCDLYHGILTEAMRVLKKNGILIFKCQDYTDSKTTMTHCYVWDWAIMRGFYPKDLAILVNKNRIYNPKLTQRHLRKTHCYFWVFRK